jgi:hypothetical protein
VGRATRNARAWIGPAIYDLLAHLFGDSVRWVPSTPRLRFAISDMSLSRRFAAADLVRVPRVLSGRAPDTANRKQVVSPLQESVCTVGRTNSASLGLVFKAAGTYPPSCGLLFGGPELK